MATPRPKLTATPDQDLEVSVFEFQGEAFGVKKRFKVAKFMKQITEAPVDAIGLALEEDSYATFLELEMTMAELQEFLEKLSQAMSGSSLKN